MARYAFDEAGYEETTDGAKRPDRSTSLKREHEAAADDLWSRGEVTHALKGADDPDTRWRTIEEVIAHVDAKPFSLKKKKQKAF